LGRVTGPPECGVSGQLLLTQPPRWCVPAGAGNHRDRVAGREGIGGGVIYPAVVELELVGLSGQQAKDRGRGVLQLDLVLRTLRASDRRDNIAQVELDDMTVFGRVVRIVP